jgi:hypothetical protein
MSIDTKEQPPTTFSHKSWSFSHLKAPIASQPSLALYSQTTLLPQLPEMIFLSSFLTLAHPSGFALSFNTSDALSNVALIAPVFQVATAESWLKAYVMFTLIYLDRIRVRSRKSFHHMTGRILHSIKALPL